MYWTISLKHGRYKCTGGIELFVNDEGVCKGNWAVNEWLKWEILFLHPRQRKRRLVEFAIYLRGD